MFDLPNLIQTVSYFGLFFIIFAETGLLMGFFLPGDSLLLTAGLLATEGSLSITRVIITCTLAAILGNLTGYFVGQKLGPLLFNKPKSRFFNPAHITKTSAYLAKHGSKTILMARFIPIIRTFVATVAGVSKMNYAVFSYFSIVGGLLWAAGLPLAGYYFGKLIPNLEKYILIIIVLVVIISLVPIALEYLKHKQLTSEASLKR